MGSCPSEWISGNSHSLDTRPGVHHVRRHMHSFTERKGDHNHIGHCGGPAIVTSHNRRYFVLSTMVDDDGCHCDCRCDICDAGI